MHASTSAYHLELCSIGELDSLGPDVRAQISAWEVELLESPARALLRLEASASHDSTRVLLRSLHGRRVTIEIDVLDPLDPWSSDVLSRFADPDRSVGLGLRSPLPTDLLPRSCPSALRDFYAHFGGLRAEHGASGELVRPGMVLGPASLLAEVGLGDPRLAENVMAFDAHGFYEIDGDWLCWLSSGEAAWIGFEHVAPGTIQRAGGCDDMLTELFRALARGIRFHAR